MGQLPLLFQPCLHLRLRLIIGKQVAPKSNIHVFAFTIPSVFAYFCRPNTLPYSYCLSANSLPWTYGFNMLFGCVTFVFQKTTSVFPH
ncbi:hypothetical protein SAMN05444359_12091 [Neolewinella agarilytica]|uniref:Uncharacterized protein n=1 Tax=Neolewinella agarilytica TaxID=478744 RepID=A0A1H9KFQ7_9BACT|nr:hypothetical protein SAMN05444359_12091 [Neolewinella agarilytica]